MTTTADLTAILAEALPAIDLHLANLDVPLNQRPTQAAIEFVTHFVEAVQEGEEAAAAPGQMGDFIATRWFSKLFAQVFDWYRERYGAAFDRKSEDRRLGVVSITGTAFELRVPTVRSRPGRPGETIWIGFPDGVRDDERAIDWIETPPNLESLTLKERKVAEAEATEVANALRFIHTGLLTVTGNDAKLNGLASGIVPRLERAAQLLLEPKSGTVQQAYWELQLACEHALKALQQQQSGTFKETHDLFSLYDGSNPVPAFKRDLLKRVPRWEETVDLRYGQGSRDSRAECLRCYRAALGIVGGTVRSMRRHAIGSAEFEIQRLPWMMDT